MTSTSGVGEAAKVTASPSMRAKAASRLPRGQRSLALRQSSNSGTCFNGCINRAIDETECDNERGELRCCNKVSEVTRAMNRCVQDSCEQFGGDDLDNYLEQLWEPCDKILSSYFQSSTESSIIESSTTSSESTFSETTPMGFPQDTRVGSSNNNDDNGVLIWSGVNGYAPVITLSVCLPIAMLLIITAIVCLLKRRKRRHNAVEESSKREKDPHIVHPDVPELEPGGKFELPAAEGSGQPRMSGALHMAAELECEGGSNRGDGSPGAHTDEYEKSTISKGKQPVRPVVLPQGTSSPGNKRIARETEAGTQSSPSTVWDQGNMKAVEKASLQSQLDQVRIRKRRMMELEELEREEEELQRRIKHI